MKISAEAQKPLGIAQFPGAYRQAGNYTSRMGDKRRAFGSRMNCAMSATWPVVNDRPCGEIIQCGPAGPTGIITNKHFKPPPVTAPKSLLDGRKRSRFQRLRSAQASSTITLRNPTPSSADIQMTEQIVEIAGSFGISVHDHIIVGENGHASLKGLKLM
jgi:hypothetical protein